jgi:hypothetical protein
MVRNITLRRRSTATECTGASVTGAVVAGARLLGPSAMASAAVGATAIGRIAIADAVSRRLRAGEVEIASLKVQELEVGGRRWPESGHE